MIANLEWFSYAAVDQGATSPYGAFLDGIHGRAKLALEDGCKIFRVG
jgi:hypothetical protein